MHLPREFSNRFGLSVKRLVCLPIALLCLLGGARGQDAFPGIVCDEDSDCFYQPAAADTLSAPALLVLSCTGAVPHDLDSVRGVADSFGLVLASCHRSRNHRSSWENDRDILATYAKLAGRYRVDPKRIFICGFSGMGAQSIQEVAAHPALFRGALSACSPQVGLAGPDLGPLTDNLFFLISREKDWNLKGNEHMFAELQDMGVVSTLQVLPGEHAPGPIEELYQAVDWLLTHTQ